MTKTNEDRAAYMREYRKKNPEKVRATEKATKQKNREAVLARKKKYRTENKEKIYAYNKEYEKNNRDMTRAIVAKKRAKRSKACPLWANHSDIRRIYAEAHNLSVKTGISHHVDHIIPINGRLVCGLHVENNLRVITAQENVRKSNSWGP